MLIVKVEVGIPPHAEEAVRGLVRRMRGLGRGGGARLAPPELVVVWAEVRVDWFAVLEGVLVLGGLFVLLPCWGGFEAIGRGRGWSGTFW